MSQRKGETRLRFWDIIVSSKELRKLIVERADELDVNIFHVVREAGLNWSTFKKRYLYSEDILSRPSIRQENILKVCEVLGLDIKLTITVTEPDKELLHKLRNKDYEPR